MNDFFLQHTVGNEIDQITSPLFSTIEIEKLLVKEECLHSGTTILDAGTGIGHMPIYLAKNHNHAHFFGIDYNKEKIELGKEIADSLKLDNVTFLSGNIENLSKEAHASYNGILSIHT